jgi:hypothetical protein
LRPDQPEVAEQGASRHVRYPSRDYATM